MDGDRIERAIQRIEAALARIDAAGNALPKPQSPESSDAYIRLSNSRDAMREDVAETLRDLDRLIEEIEA